jgi:hypothetical protein
MAKKEKLPVLVTPPGEGIWPRLQKPDTKFKAEGEYSTRLAFDPEDARVQAFVKRIEELVDDAFEQAKDQNPKFRKQIKRISPVKAETDDNGDETGRILLNFKKTAQATSKKDGKTYTFRVACYDAAGNPLPKGVTVGGGSILRVNAEVRPYFNAKDKEAGVSLRLEAVQVIELKEYKGKDASAFGFEKVEGYDSSTQEQSEDEEQDEFEKDGQEEAIEAGALNPEGEEEEEAEIVKTVAKAAGKKASKRDDF